MGFPIEDVASAATQALGRASPGVRPSNIPELFGRELLHQAGKRVASVGSRAAVRLAPEDQEDRGRKFYDMSSVFIGDSPGLEAKLFAPENFDEAPTLFTYIPYNGKKIWTPFFQVGTVAGVETPWLRIAMDYVLDPWNFAHLGTLGVGAKLGEAAIRQGGRLAAREGAGAAARLAGGALSAAGRRLERGLLSGLTLEGQMQRVAGVLMDQGARGRTGAELVEQLNAALDMAVRVRGAGVSDKLIRAARAGDKKAVRRLLDGAIRTGRGTPEEMAMLASLKRDSKVLARLLDRQQLFAARGDLGAIFFLQATTRERRAQGAVNDLLAFPRIASPLQRPFAFTRQMLGFSYRSETFVFPGSKLLATGLDSMLKPQHVLPEDLRLGPILDDAARSGRQFAEGDVTAFDVDANLEPILVLTTGPRDRFRQLMSDTGVPNEPMLFDMFKRAKGLEASVEIGDNPEGWAEFLEETIRSGSDAQARRDRALGALMNMALEQAASGIRRSSRFLAGRSVDEVANAVRTRTEQIRRWADLFSIQSIASDGYGFAHGFAGRANAITALAANTGAAYTEVLQRKFGRSGAALFSELIPRLNENYKVLYPDGIPIRQRLTDDLSAPFPETLRLTDEQLDKLSEDSAFFADILQREGEQVRNLLQRTGMDEEAQYLVWLMHDALERIGQNLQVTEGVLKNLFGNYFPAAFEPNARFFRRFKTSRSKLNEFANVAFEDGLTGFNRLLKEFEVGSRLEAHEVPQGFTKMRKLTEELALAMERGRYGQHKRDGVGLFTGYLDAANKALMVNTFVRDLPLVAPRFFRGLLSSRSDRAAAQGFTDEELASLPLIAHHGHPLADRARSSGLMIDIEVAGRTTPEELSDLRAFGVGAERALGQIEPRALGDFIRDEKLKLAGQVRRDANGHFKSRFQLKGEGFNLVKNGRAVQFDPDWVTTGEFPSDVNDAMRLKRHINNLARRAGRRQHSAARSAIKKQVTRAKKIGKGGQRLPDRVLVWRGIAPQFQEAFRLYSNNGKASQLLRLYDDINYSLKAWVLMGDIFHYNVLAFNQFLSNPMSLARNLRESAGQVLPGVAEGRGVPALSSARGAVVGALAGAGGTALAGGDMEEILAGGAVGSFYTTLIGSARQNAIHMHKSLMLNPDASDLIMWMGLGGWTGKPDDRAIGFMTRHLQTMSRNLARNPGVGARLLKSPITQLAHISEAWDQELWGLMHNGSKQMYFAERWSQSMARLQAHSVYSTHKLAREFEDLRASGRLNARLEQMDLVRKDLAPLQPPVRRERSLQEIIEHEEATQDFIVLTDDVAEEAEPVIRRGSRRDRDAMRFFSTDAGGPSYLRGSGLAGAPRSLGPDDLRNAAESVGGRRYLYHVARRENADAILESGLIRAGEEGTGVVEGGLGRPRGSPAGTSLSPSREQAEAWRLRISRMLRVPEESLDIVRIDAEDVIASGAVGYYVPYRRMASLRFESRSTIDLGGPRVSISESFARGMGLPWPARLDEATVVAAMQQDFIERAAEANVFDVFNGLQARTHHRMHRDAFEGDAVYENGVLRMATRNVVGGADAVTSRTVPEELRPGFEKAVKVWNSTPRLEEIHIGASLRNFAAEAVGFEPSPIPRAARPPRRPRPTPGLRLPPERLESQLEIPSGVGVDPRMRKYIANRRFEMQRQLASEIMQSANNLFGGQAFRNLLGDPSYAFTLRRFLLAPDWTLSRLNMAASMFMNMGPMKSMLMGAGLGSAMEIASHGFEQDSVPWRGIVFGGGIAPLAAAWGRFTARALTAPGTVPPRAAFMAREAQRLTAAALVGGYTFSTLANRGFTGHWMHENEEGKRLSIQLPGADGLGRPRFATLGKQWKEFGEFAGFVDEEKFPAPIISRTASKLSVPFRFGVNVLSNVGYRSGDHISPIFRSSDDPLETGHRLLDFVLSSATPIIAAGPFRAAMGLVEEAFTGEPAGVSPGEAGLRFAGFPISKSKKGSVTDLAIQSFLETL